jgi:hypothetical protein
MTVGIVMLHCGLGIRNQTINYCSASGEKLSTDLKANFAPLDLTLEEVLLIINK